MTLHPIDLDRISRAMNDPDAITRREPANDHLPACSQQDMAETIALVIVGAFVVAVVLFAWVAA